MAKQKPKKIEEKVKNFNKYNFINHPEKEKIISEIKKTKESKSFGKNGLRGLTKHFIHMNILKKKDPKKPYVLDVEELQYYFWGEIGLLRWCAGADPWYQSTFERKLDEILEKGGTKHDFIFKPVIETFFPFSLDIIAYENRDETQSMASRLNFWFEILKNYEKIQTVGLEIKNKDSEIFEYTYNDKFYKDHYEIDIKDKNILIIEDILNPHSLIGMSKTLEKLGGKIIGGMGLFYSDEFNPEYAIALAKADISDITHEGYLRF